LKDLYLVINFATLLDMAMTELQTTKSNAAMARKHRIAMRNKNRSPFSQDESSTEDRNNKRPRMALEESESNSDSSEPMVVGSSSDSSASTPEDILESIRKKKPHITGIKNQSRYDPGVTMTKDELKAWRKEARRVRNRESAAASRQKNRESIDILETEVKEVQSKYDAALQYILNLEEKLRRSGSSSFPSTAVLRQDLEEVKKVSPEAVEATRPMISPPQSPTPVERLQEGTENQAQRPRPVQVQNDLDKNTPYQPFSRYHPNHPTTLNSQKHIIDNMIIRPIACV